MSNGADDAPQNDESPSDASAAASMPSLEAIEVVPESEDSEPSRISEPGKLMRIAVMLRELREEVHRASIDEAGLERLRSINDQALSELKSVLSGDLRDELADFAQSFSSETPSESEIRIAQAQMIGWLDGLFQGIQAAIVNQQMAARQQLEQMQRRGLPSGAPAAPGKDTPPGSGHYL